MMSESALSKLMSDIVEYPPLVTNDTAQNTQIKKKLKAIDIYRLVPMVLDDVHVGIEVEVERCNAKSSAKVFELTTLYPTFWDATEDNSLRNNGLEFISKPVSGGRIPVALAVLRDYLNAHFVDHEFTSRTSVHVHLNCRHMTQDSFFNFLLLYLVAEPIFYYYADNLGSNRSQNNFCVPIEASKFGLNLPQIISLFKEGSTKAAMRQVFLSWKKYNGFNLLPMKTLGTVEFRHLGGTLNLEFLVKWINMILSLRKYADETTLEQIKDTIFQLNTISSYSVFAESLLGITDLPSSFLQPALEDSSTTVKSVFSYIDLTKTMLAVGDNLIDSPLYKQLSKYDGVVHIQSEKEKCAQFGKEVESYLKQIEEETDTKVINKLMRRKRLAQSEYDKSRIKLDNVYYRVKQTF